MTWNSFFKHKMFQIGTQMNSETFKSVSSRRPTSTPVIGKRVNQEAEVIQQNEENRYPIQVPFDKVRPKTAVISSPKKTAAKPAQPT
jgi:hypothetical protein